ncbi:MAG TPA: hypothetical protein VGP07_01355 [Polyangia bacterium]|jgi:hypothetical protein
MTTKRSLWLTVGLLLTTEACRSKTEPSVTTFTRAMNAYLQARGDLCIARTEWPVDVTLDDFAARTRDAVQMPALERVGVVDSSVIPGASKVTRYQLTALGRARYIDRATHQPLSPESTRRAGADFCMARLSLDKIVGWELRKGATGPNRALVTYQYQVEAPAWTQNPAVRGAFPAVARVIGGARSAALEEELTSTTDGWVANELLPAGATEAPARMASVTKTAGSRP